MSSYGIKDIWINGIKCKQFKFTNASKDVYIKRDKHVINDAIKSKIESVNKYIVIKQDGKI